MEVLLQLLLHPYRALHIRAAGDRALSCIRCNFDAISALPVCSSLQAQLFEQCWPHHQETAARVAEALALNSTAGALLVLLFLFLFFFRRHMHIVLCMHLLPGSVVPTICIFVLPVGATNILGVSAE